MVKKFAVIGSPISHSLSPTIHQAAYRLLELDWIYDSAEVTQDAFPAFMSDNGEKYSGLSVTMPLKLAAYKIAIHHSPTSSATGLANTLLKMGASWSSYNTDVFGLGEALRRQHNDGYENVLVIGTGATARSSLLALRLLNPQVRVHVVGRNADNIQNLISFAKTLDISACSSEISKVEAMDLTISTIPGTAWSQFALPQNRSSEFGNLFDVSYNPWPSEAAQLWEQNGGSAISGIHMLIWQAIAQIRIFLLGDENAPLSNEDALAANMLSVANSALK